MTRGIFTLFLFAGIALGQPKPKDIYGWGKIKWGMTLAEAITACGSDCAEDAKVDVGDGIALKVDLASTGVSPDKYKYVPSRLVATVELSTIPELRLHRSRNDVYMYLRNALIQKYGAPTSEDRKPDDLDVMVNSAVWVFPSTTITLESRDIHNGMLFLIYRKADPKVKDAL